MRTWLVIALLIAAAVTAVAAADWFAAGVPVQTAAVRTGSIREFVDEQAKTRLPRTYLITMPLAGRIAAIDKEVGDPVQEGEVVAQLVPRDLELELQLAQRTVERIAAALKESEDLSIERTALRQALEYVKSMWNTVQAAEYRVEAGKAKFDFAAEHFRRIAKVYEPATEQYETAQLGEVQSRVEYEQDKLVHSALQSVYTATALLPEIVRQYMDRKLLSAEVRAKEMAEAEARLQQVELNAQRGTLRSPVRGVVLERFVSDERYLPAGELLLSIGQLEHLQVEADVLTQDAVRIRTGSPVEVYGASLHAPPLRGRVTQIYPAGFTKISSLGVEQQRVKVIVELDDDARQRLGQQPLGVGYRVRVRIITDEKSGTLVIPRSGLFRNAAGQWQVFVVRQGIARLQDVQVGLLNDELAEVTAGLQPGQQVVLTPEASLVDGSRVSPVAGTR
jgi:HlyD family secretion protein